MNRCDGNINDGLKWSVAVSACPWWFAKRQPEVDFAALSDGKSKAWNLHPSFPFPQSHFSIPSAADIVYIADIHTGGPTVSLPLRRSYKTFLLFPLFVDKPNV